MQTPDLASITRGVEAWFERHQRPLPWRETYDPYHVWLSEIMLQQTRMEVVLPYFARFLSRFPDVEALAAATDDEVTAAWSGLGYYRRARMLRAGAVAVVERFGGTIPDAVEELLTIPGAGRYTAGAIASIAGNRRAAIVDGNVARIFARLFGIEAPLASPALMREAWAIATRLVDACASPRMFNQGLMELGALVCRPRNPACLLCPLRNDCVALATGRTSELPRAKPKKATTIHQISLYLVRDSRGRILLRREKGQLMTAMYHLPLGQNALFPTASRFDPGVTELRGTFRHTITTRRIEFSVYESQPGPHLRDRGDEYEWIDPEKLDEVPHPSYVRKALALLRK